MYDIYNNDPENCTNSSDIQIIKTQKQFSQVEEAGSEITYQCINCRTCKTCKDHDQTEITSIKEEIEQDMINQSMHVDLKQRQTIANLPSMHDPAVKLYPNKIKALKVYNQQLKKLSKQPQDKEQVIQSEKKLQDLGHVEFTRNLPNNLQVMLKNSPIQNFIPWRVIWKVNSVSTPCRLVFDASQISKTGYSLNDILVKGRNNMNKLVEIVIRWYIHKVAFHTDIQKMYNSIKLHEQNWCLPTAIYLAARLRPNQDPRGKSNQNPYMWSKI